MRETLSDVFCQETSKHVGSVCDLENGIDDLCTSQKIETCFDDEIGTSGGTVINGSDARRTGIVMNRRTWISFWSGSCGVCCGNGFSGSGVNLGDYCCRCGGSYGYGSIQSPNGPKR